MYILKYFSHSSPLFCEHLTSITEIGDLLPILSGTSYTTEKLELDFLYYALSTHTHTIFNARYVRGYEDYYIDAASDYRWPLIFVPAVDLTYVVAPNDSTVFKEKVLTYLKSLERDSSNLFARKHCKDHVALINDPNLIDKRNLIWFDPEKNIVFSYNVNAVRRLVRALEPIRRHLTAKYKDKLVSGDVDKKLLDLYTGTPFCWSERYK